MPLVATWLDVVIGVDFHTILVPSVAGPVPIPSVPHPHAGLLGDPAGMAVSMATSALVSMCTGQRPAAPGVVLVNNMPVVTTADISKNTSLLPHLPMPPGIAFAKPPSGHGTLHLGSLATSASGASVVRMGDIVFSCSDPVAAPTSTVLSIPKGAPVIDNAPPGFNPLSAATNFVAGKIVRTAFKAAGNAFKFFARHMGPRLRNWLEKSVCFFTGHPVNVVTGCVVTSEVEFELPGALPLRFERNYSSGWAHRDGPLGWGWSHSFDRAVWTERAGIVVRLGDGREIVFDTAAFDRGIVRVRGEIYDPVTGFALTRLARGKWRLTYPDGLIDTFAPVPGEPSGPEGRGAMARVIRTSRKIDRIAIGYHYDERARLSSVTDSGGRVVKFDYDQVQPHRLRRIALPDPEIAQTWTTHAEYQYSERGDLAEASDALGNAIRYEYGSHLLCAEVQKNGIAFFWGYDGRSSQARCLRTWGEDQHGAVIFNQKIYYDPQNRKTIVSNSHGHKTVFSYNELNLVTEVRDPQGGVTGLSYNDELKLTAETDPLGQTTRYSYDHRGHCLSTRLPDGARFLTKYHPDHPELVTFVRDLRQAIWRLEYDSRGQLIRERGPHGLRRSLEWREGLLMAEQAGDARVEHEYDESGNRTVSRVQPSGTVVRRKFDRRGRLIAVATSQGRSELSYDLLDRPVRMTEPDGNILEVKYDPQGNIVEFRDRRRHKRWEYSGFNWIAALEEAGDVVRFAYDPEGAPLEIRNERNIPYRFEYDPCGRIVKEVGFDRQEVRYKRDKGGRVIEETGPKGKTKFAVDALGRVTRCDFWDGTWNAFAYAPDGLVIEAANQHATVNLERDDLGRVVRESTGEDWVTCTYTASDLVGVRSSLGAEMAISRDAMGDPERIRLGSSAMSGGHEIAFRFDAAGMEIERQLPGEAIVSWSRDEARRPVQQQVQAASAADSWLSKYVWDFGNRLASLADSRFGTTEFEHDARGRLYAERNGQDVQYRAPDSVGNLYRTPERSDRSYARGGVIREDGTQRFIFDRAGNLVRRFDDSGSTWEYAWDAVGMLTSVEPPVGREKVTFTYDALGRRLSKKVGDFETRWFWSGDVMLHERRNGAQDETWYHDPDDFSLLAKFEGDARFSIVSNYLGTPTAAYDEQGIIAWHMQLDSYGLPREIEGVSSAEGFCSWRWPGQYDDEETGLYYNRFRYYDPQLGMYLGQDPIRLVGCMHPYAYPFNPLAEMDPLGLNARALRKSIELEGRSIDKSQSPHHIVAENQGGYAAHSRKLLARHRLEIDDEVNGAVLWGTHPKQVARLDHPGRAAARASGRYHAGPHIHGTAIDRLIFRFLRSAERAGAAPEAVLREIQRRMEASTWRDAVKGCND